MLGYSEKSHARRQASNIMANNDAIYEKHYTGIVKLNNYLIRYLRVNLIEITLLGLFPLIVVAGQLVYLMNIPFLDQDSDYESESNIMVNHNYFTSKGNIINRFFVKQGWGWTTLVFVLILSKYLLVASKNKKQVNKKLYYDLLKSIGKFTIITGWWILFTQWCFGKPIMDRVFLATGGKCGDISHSNKLLEYIESHPSIKSFLRQVELDTGSYLMPGPVIPKNMELPVDHKYEAAISSAVCRRIGGKWTGGHDPSGHCFLLVQSSLFILFELMPLARILLQDLYETHETFRWLVDRSETLSISVKHYIYGDKDAKSSSIPERNQTRLSQVVRFICNPLVAGVSLVTLWCWMLLVTSTYFHSLVELLGGTFAGYFAVVPLYIFPRFV